MRIKTPSPSYLKGTNGHAILLLHSFTGTNRDVKHLAAELNDQGFSCYAPNYPGHGLLLKDFMTYNVDDWWEEVEKAYQFLVNEGYESISATGVSLGGLMTLKLAQHYPLKRIAVMSAPKEKSGDGLIEHLVYYSQRMSNILNLDQQASSAQLAAIDDYEGEITKFQHFIDDIMTNLNVIKIPANILFGGKDEPSYETSAHFIYEHLGSVDKELNGLKDSHHLMTHGEGRDILEENVIRFFNALT
ncbi:TPA: carboxylesterase [Staphylococcus aureus]|uniref:alpha/beta hydrolase n=1 Tax=Staphylococcus aureus TaxID=1280 RepID=UPI001364412A|nr:carboxylesterase [Staphylococcus aureus]QHL58432.1 alpha/beta fold hydrolase [Staphylococcus aureus]HCY8988541.1 carboxylesterase [Staphylococcus aureus]